MKVTSQSPPTPPPPFSVAPPQGSYEWLVARVITSSLTFHLKLQAKVALAFTSMLDLKTDRLRAYSCEEADQTSVKAC